MKLVPIGVIRSPVRNLGHEDWEAVVAEVVVNSDLEPALDQIEAFSHLLIVWWMDRVKPDERHRLRAHPRHDPANPLVGVFATRSPKRPNPLGVTVVKLLERDGPVLRVKGLDAIDVTPVLDIKPYLAGHDATAHATIPPWMKEAHRKRAGS
jgi:tRNA-Thr(GGU) m(6)t(6)A37 methyltransferase TsaA